MLGRWPLQQEKQVEISCSQLIDIQFVFFFEIMDLTIDKVVVSYQVNVAYEKCEPERTENKI
jgi:hypothetical protein